MTKRTKVLSLLLALVMVISLMPTVALAAGGTDDFYRIVHLDCGRKYFTKDWIKSLINEMSAAGYTHLELAFGNDGLRFLLDDMSVTVDGTTYSSENVTTGIQNGNKEYYDAGTYNELNQAEMDEIIAYAKTNGISIIPLMNTPGHMDAIVTCMKYVGISSPAYNTSVRTVDVNNSTAVAFTQNLVKKYAEYFASRGCTIFNMGCDEYANDIYTSGSMGFGNLVSTGNYGKFVTYVNDLAKVIKAAGMTPMAFNDGFYFNGNTSSGTFDTDIMISFWTSGWSGYTSETAAQLATRGHKMINTNGAFYYVLGKNDNFDSGYSYASNFSNTAFMGSNVSNPTGSMFCIWCDFPNAETETEVAQKVRLPLRAMAARMKGESIDTINTGVISGGFNEDGSINEPAVPDVTVENSDAGVTVKVTAPGLTGLTVTMLDKPSYVSDGAVVVGYDITPEDESGKYTGAGTVSIQLTNDVKDKQYIRVYDVTNKEFIGSSVADGVITFTASHFSEYDIVAQDAIPVTEERTITVTKGQTVTDTIKDNDYTGSNIDRSDLEESIATVSAVYEKVDGETTKTLGSTVSMNSSGTYTGVISDGNNNYLVLDGTELSSTTDINKATVWTVIRSSGYGQATYTIESDGYYLNRNNSALSIGTASTTTWYFSSTYGFFCYDWSTYKSYYLRNNSGAWELSNNSSTGNKGLLYSVTETTTDPVDATTVSFTGVKVGTTYVTVGHIRYTINVIAEDLSTIDPLTIEYWITNTRVKDKDGKTSYSVSAADAYSETGIEIATFLPYNTYNARTLEYWRSRLLDKTLTNNSTSGKEEQTIEAGDDETRNGTGFTKVRYWNGTWAVYTDNNEWVSVESKHQLVAYYMEIVNIDNSDGDSELHVNAADWGTKGDGSGSWGYTPESSRCSVSVQLVYEDSTTNPATTTVNDLKSKTILYGYWSGGRGLGTMIFTGKQNYEIYKVTAETGTMTSSVGSNNTVTATGFTWNTDEETVWEGDATKSVAIANTAKIPSFEAPYDNLAWNTDNKNVTIYNDNNAILIRVYVRTVATESALTVHYIDQTANNYEFYNYNIAVKGGTTFDSRFARGTEKNTLVYNTVPNYNGVTQTVTADLSKLLEINAQYRYSDYTCVKVERSADGKDVYLYYTFDNAVNFVVDYGLPLDITLTELNATLAGKTITNVTAKITNNESYGDVKVNNTNGTYTVRYTPTKLISSIDSFTVTVTGTQKGDDESTVTYMVYIYPATTVYYEDSFVKFTGDWKTEGTTAEANQAADKLGDAAANVYGYDKAYDSFAKYSLGSATKTTVKSTDDSTAWPTATFTFKGTGFDIISLTDSDSGAIFVTVKDKEGTAVKKFVVNNYYGYSYAVNEDGKGEWKVNKESTDRLYQVPVMKVSGLDYDEYEVEIKVAYSELFDVADKDAYSFWLDAIRIYDPAGTTLDTQYGEDGEKAPSYQRIKSIIIDANNFNNSDGTMTGGAVFIDGKGENADVDDYKNFGPNNETYLAENQAVAFKLIATAQPAEVQIGVKLALGESATLSGSLDDKVITTATDMYYKLSELGWTAKTTDGKTYYESDVITIGNNTEDTKATIVSLTNIKITGGAKLTTLDAVKASTGEEALAAAFVDAQTVEEAIKLLNETPEEPIAPNPGGDPTKPDDGETWKNPYADVDENDWYYEFVKTVSEKELMNGVETGFDPNGKLSRAMLVTILYRLSGAEKVEAEHKFEDVADNMWYTDAIAWAHANGIVNGYSETQFAPNREISRQELAAVIARYAAKYGIELKKADGTTFADDAAIADYARDAVYSLKASGILSGKGENSFDPLGTTTRAEAAKVIALLSTY